MRTMHQHLGLPIPVAFLAIATEFFGGAGLMVGLLSRVAALGIAVSMVAAILMGHGRYGLFLNWFGDRKGHGFEYHLLAIALAAVIIARGSGAVSLDRLLYRSIL
jgi:putative oxidoreductase